MKRLLSLVFILALTAALAGCQSSGGDTSGYPKTDIQGVVSWGAGGGLDNNSRALTPHVEKILGKSIIMTNRAGASGSVALQYAYEQKSDGYTILFASEGVQTFKVTGANDKDFDDFIPILLFLETPGVILVAPDSPYQTLEELFDACLASPGEIRMATTGAGGLPDMLGAMARVAVGIETNNIPFEGDAAAVTAVMGGHADFTMVGLTSAEQNVKGGAVKALATVTKEPLDKFEGVPCVLDIYPAYADFLPWSSFHGVYVKKDTPEEIVKTLTEAFKQGWETEEYQTYIQESGSLPLGIYGDEASRYVDDWKRITSYILYDSGADVTDPAEFGIKRIGE